MTGAREIPEFFLFTIPSQVLKLRAGTINLGLYQLALTAPNAITQQSQQHSDLEVKQLMSDDKLYGCWVQSY